MDGAVSNVPDVTTLPDRGEPGNVLSSQQGEGDAGVRPTRWEQYGARFRQLGRDLPVGVPFMGGDSMHEGALPRMYKDWAFERSLEGKSTKISADEANARFPGIPEPFKESVYPEVAQARFNYAKRRQLEQDWIERGPPVGALSTLGVGLAAALDPVNMGLGMAAGAAGMAAGLPTAGLAGFGAAVGTNFIGNLAGEIPAYLQNKSQNLKVSALDSTEGAFYGALGGTVLHYGIRAAIRRAEARYRDIPPAAQAKMVREGVAQHLNGEKIDTTTTATNMESRRAGFTRPDGPQSQYQFRVLAHPSEAAHYRAFEAEHNGPVSLSSELGASGVHAADHIEVANNLAGTPESNFEGRIQEVHIDPQATFIDLDQPLPEKIVARILSEAEKKSIQTTALTTGAENPLAGGEKGLTVDHPLKSMTGWELIRILNDLDADTTGSPRRDALKALAQEEGFDGYRFVENAEGASPSNRVFMFDEAKGITQGETLTANRDLVPHDPGAEAEYRKQIAESPEAQRDYEPEVEKKVQEQAARAPIEQTEIDPMLVAQHTDAINRLKEMAKDDPEIDAAIQELKHQEVKDAQEIQAIKDLIDCAGSDIA